MICEDGEVAAIEVRPEVLHSPNHSKAFSISGSPRQLCASQCARGKGDYSLKAIDRLAKDRSHSSWLPVSRHSKFVLTPQQS